MAGCDHRGGEVGLLRPAHGVDGAWGLEAAAAVAGPAEFQLGVVRPAGPDAIQVDGGWRSGGRVGGQPRVVELVPAGGQDRCGEAAAAVIGRPEVQVVGVGADVPAAGGVEGDGGVAAVGRVLQATEAAPARPGVEGGVGGDLGAALVVVGDAGAQQVAGVAGVDRQAWLGVGDELVLADPHVGWPTWQRRLFRRRGAQAGFRRRRTDLVGTGAGHQPGAAPGGELEGGPTRQRQISRHRTRSERRRLATLEATRSRRHKVPPLGSAVVVRRQVKRCLPGRDHRELAHDPVVLEAEQSSAPASSFAAAATPPWKVPTTSRGGLGYAVALIDRSAQPASGRPHLMAHWDSTMPFRQPAASPANAMTGIGSSEFRPSWSVGLSSVVAGAGVGLMSPSPDRPTQPMAELTGGTGEQCREQMLDLVARQVRD